MYIANFAIRCKRKKNHSFQKRWQSRRMCIKRHPNGKQNKNKKGRTRHIMKTIVSCMLHFCYFRRQAFLVYFFTETLESTCPDIDCRFGRVSCSEEYCKLLPWILKQNECCWIVCDLWIVYFYYQTNEKNK